MNAAWLGNLKNRRVGANGRRRQAKVLRDAVALLRDGGWCQDVLARDSEGEDVPVFSPRACQWCLTGAVHRASNDDLTVACDAMSTLRTMLGEVDLSGWNDCPERTEREVVDAMECCENWLERRVGR